MDHANISKLEQRVDSVSAELKAAMVGYSAAQEQNSFTVQTTAKVPTMQKQMKVKMLTTLYGELVKNLELSKTLSAREEPLITIIDRPHYPRAGVQAQVSRHWRGAGRVLDTAVFGRPGVFERFE